MTLTSFAHEPDSRFARDERIYWNGAFVGAVRMRAGETRVYVERAGCGHVYEGADVTALTAECAECA